jgi:hypothetical protein
MTVRDNAEYKLRDGLAGFNARNVKLPTAVTDAVAHWQAIKNRTPEGQPATAIRDAVMANADDDEIDRLLLRDLGSTRLRSAFAQAAVSAAVAALGAIRDARAEIHAQLSTLADKSIADLGAVAALGDCTLDGLVRSGKTAEARLFADRAVIGSELHALFGLRDGYLYPGGLKAARVGHIDCTVWRDPTAVEGTTGSSVVDRYLSGLRAGGQLWFPDAEQAVAAAQPLFDAWQRQAEVEAAERRSQGSYVGFGVGGGW